MKTFRVKRGTANFTDVTFERLSIEPMKYNPGLAVYGYAPETSPTLLEFGHTTARYFIKGGFETQTEAGEWIAANVLESVAR